MKTIAVIMMVLMLTLSNWILLGTELVAYALDVINETNENNVQFTAYFKDDSEAKVAEKTEVITSESMKLYIEVSVKKEGYFNGRIEIADSNFKLKEQEYGTDVEKVVDNTIYLNQINAGDTVTLELAISPITDTNINVNYLLGKTSSIKIKGTYTSAEGDKQIDSTREVCPKFSNPYISGENSTCLEANLITNKVYETTQEDGTTANKRIVQYEINSSMQNNLYPIKQTCIEITTPENVENYEVLERGLYATNGECKNAILEEGVVYSEENKKISITIDNTPTSDNIISWDQLEDDTIIVTFVLGENDVIGDCTVNQKITLYDDAVFTNQTTIGATDNLDGIIDYEIIAESEIYKGNLYTKNEKQIKETTKIDIRYKSIANIITVTEGTTNYKNEDGEKTADLKYTSSSIYKEDLVNVLGTKGTLTIKDLAGNVIKEINSETEADESGEIAIGYAEPLSGLIIVVSNAENTGVIEIIHERTITENTYTRDEIRSFNSLELKGELVADKNVSAKSVNASVTLKETVTDARVEINPSTLSTTQTNEGVELLVILKSDSEAYDLFKNPTIQMELPSEISSINVKETKIVTLGNEITAQGALDKNENGNFVISFKLAGEQTNFADVAREGILLRVKADITLKLDTPTKVATIKTLYTNENGEEDIYDTETTVNFESQYGLVAYTKVSGYNSQNTTLENISSSAMNAVLDVNGEGKTANVQYKLINNYAKDLSNIEVVGSLAVKDENENTFTTALNSLNVDKENVSVYYTKDSMSSENINWQETIDNIAEAKGYKIVISTITVGETVTINESVILPEGNSYGENAVISNTVNYQYEGQANSKTQEIKFSTEELVMNTSDDEAGIVTFEDATPVVESNNGITVVTVAKTEGKVTEDGTDIVAKDLLADDSVREGQMITYYATITNSTGKNLTNVVVTATHENAEIWGIVEKEDLNGFNYTEYENVGKNSEISKVETLNSGESKTISWYVIVDKDVEEQANTYGTVCVTADGLETQEFKTQTNSIEQANLVVQVKNLVNEEAITYNKSNLRSVIALKNISEEEMKNVELKISTLNLENLGEKAFYSNEDNSVEYSIKEVNDDNVTIVISSISSGEEIEIYFTPTVSDFDLKIEKQTVKVLAEANYGGNTYISNVYQNIVYQDSTYFETSLIATPETNEKYIENGDVVTFTMTVTNTSEYVSGIAYATFELDDGFVVDSVKEINGEEETEIDDYIDENTLTEQIILDELQTKKIVVVTHIDFSQIYSTTINANFKINEDEYTKQYKIKSAFGSTIETEDDDETGEDDNGENAGNTDNVDNTENGETPGNTDNADNTETGENSGNADNTENSNNTESSKYVISGTIWNDANRDGIKGTDENALSGIKVDVLNTKTNIYEQSTITAQDGTYKFELANGKYIIIFEYDSTKYVLTEKSDGTSLSAVSKAVTINGKEITALVTDEINLSSNKTGMDIGLAEKKTFDLELSKYINKIVVQNTAGTTTYNYSEETSTKVEIKSKYLSGSTVLIEYGIKVKNTGDLSGYVYGIVDYLPDGLEFSSELNTNWYKADGNLYNTSLQDTEIQPGEEKEITLILTKKMTTNNVGLVNNTAEIYLDQNALSLADIDSTAGNKVNSEDDFGSANVIIAIATGGLQVYILGGLIAIICALAIVAVYFVRKEIFKERR
jgi:hypothetical protein